MGRHQKQSQVGIYDTGGGIVDYVEKAFGAFVAALMLVCGLMLMSIGALVLHVAWLFCKFVWSL